MDRRTQRASGLRLLLAAGVLGLWFQMPGIASAQQSCLADVSATGSTFRSFEPTNCGGLIVRISIPNQCVGGKPCGFATVLNGITLANGTTDRNDNLEALGRDQGFIVLRAQGPDMLGAPALRPQDTLTIIGLIQEALTKLKPDPQRIHVAGFSQGAGATLQIACMRPDLIASVAVIAPAGGLTANCGRDGLPVSGMFFTQSSQDGLVPAANTRRTVQTLVTGMGLTMQDGKMIQRVGPNAAVTRFMNPKGQVLEFFEHDFGGATVGNGHCFPGSFEGPQPLAALTMQEILQRVAMGQSLGEISKMVRFACMDDAQLRIGPAMLTFFMNNPKR